MSNSHYFCGGFCFRRKNDLKGDSVKFPCLIQFHNVGRKKVSFGLYASTEGQVYRAIKEHLMSSDLSLAFETPKKGHILAGLRSVGTFEILKVINDSMSLDRATLILGKYVNTPLVNIPKDEREEYLEAAMLVESGLRGEITP